uniref:Uncharacterized protein n=1 Tax=Megaselia scalaris TaxID=36166 RepID=T1GLM6_MEGSC
MYSPPFSYPRHSVVFHINVLNDNTSKNSQRHETYHKSQTQQISIINQPLRKVVQKEIKSSQKEKKLRLSNKTSHISFLFEMENRRKWFCFPLFFVAAAEKSFPLQFTIAIFPSKLNENNKAGKFSY